MVGKRKSGFSLTEILIVIALIVLILALSLPAFNFISGSRSIEGAQNVISAYLGQARASAVGLQEIRGVLFYYDPGTDREMMGLVHQTPSKTGDAGINAAVQVWLEFVPDTESVPLPKGVGIQLTNDPGAANYDRYIGFNPLPNSNQASTDPQVGDAILFDGYGRLVSEYWGLRLTPPTITANNGVMNATGQLLFRSEYAANANATAADQIMQTSAIVAPRSSVGFILFDRNVAQEQLGSSFNLDPDFTHNKSASSSEQGEESWLDNNSTPYCIDRYNGTLLKAE